jgi:hypothetical protein
MSETPAGQGVNVPCDGAWPAERVDVFRRWLAPKNPGIATAAVKPRASRLGYQFRSRSQSEHRASRARDRLVGRVTTGRGKAGPVQRILPER